MKASIFSILILLVAYSQNIVAQNTTNSENINTTYYFFNEKCRYTSVKNSLKLFMSNYENDILKHKHHSFFVQLLLGQGAFEKYETIFSYQKKHNRKIYNIYTANCTSLMTIARFDTANLYSNIENSKNSLKEYSLSLSPQSAFVLDSITSKCGDCETWYLYKKIISRKHKNRIKYTPLFRVTYENIELNINILDDIYTDENYW